MPLSGGASRVRAIGSADRLPHKKRAMVLSTCFRSAESINARPSVRSRWYSCAEVAVAQQLRASSGGRR